MLVRAENITAGAVVAEGLAAAGVVVPRGCIAARAVETAEVAGAGGCVAAGTTKVARLAVAGGCWATGRQKSRGWPEPEAARRHERAAVAGSFLAHIVVRYRAHVFVPPPQ